MAAVTWDIVRKIIDRDGLDQLDVWGDPGKKAKILDARTHDEVISALDMLQSGATGGMFVEAWKSGTKKGDGYSWTITGGAVPVAGIGATAGGPGWETYFDLKLKHELMLRDQADGSGERWKGLERIAMRYYPIIAKHVGLDVPVNGHDRDDDLGDDAENDYDEIPGMTEEEVQDGLDQVVAFMKKDPASAKAYLATLKRMHGDV